MRRCRYIGSLVGFGLGLFIAAQSCFQLPPRIPEDYVGGPVEPDWPPLAVYHPDPFHPANRLFQRGFVINCETVCGDVPLANRKPLAAVDRAEILTLLSELEEKDVARGGADRLPARGFRLFEGDLRLLARLLGASAEKGDGEVAHRIEEVLRRLGLEEPSSANLPTLPPPPMGPTQLGFVSVVGHPHPPSNGLERWVLDRDGNRTETPRVFQLRRERWLNNQAPWEELQPDSKMAVLDAPEAVAKVRVGTISQLCRGCHGKRS